ncbi:DNA pilot protein [Microvirus mar56]|uniref:DNA pilot protein n=1 Tax=Microvirus mar56 TaxID=2851192 RepID=A0A8F5RB23_9VIRU|nr:DNA pilot protein [Microvirus mar56]
MMAGFWKTIGSALGSSTGVGAMIGAGTSILGNILGNNAQNKINQQNLAAQRQENQLNRDFNAVEAQKQRDFQLDMWNRTNEYNSPEAMLARGLNPYLEKGGVAASMPSGGASANAGAAPLPSMQAFRPDFSSVPAAIASFAQARKAAADTEYTERTLPFMLNKIHGDTNWRNHAVGLSGFWNENSGRLSAKLDQSKERQELQNMEYAGRLTAAQEASIMVDTKAQEILNKYLDAEKQAELMIQAQTYLNLYAQGVYTEKQIETEIKRAILVGAEARGQKIANDIADATAKSVIKATNQVNELRYREAAWESNDKNLNVRKKAEYERLQFLRDSEEEEVKRRRKENRMYYYNNTLGKLFGAFGAGFGFGAGNTIGTSFGSQPPVTVRGFGR